MNVMVEFVPRELHTVVSPPANSTEIGGDVYSAASDCDHRVEGVEGRARGEKKRYAFGETRPAAVLCESVMQIGVSVVRGPFSRRHSVGYM